MPDSEKFLEAALAKEILINEKLKATLLLSVSVVLIIIFSLVLIFFGSFFENNFSTLTPFYWMLVVFIVFGIREINVRLVLTRLIKKGGLIKQAFRYINVIVEVSVPTIILFLLASYFQNLLVLSTPIVFIYFIILILTTLSLDIKISITAGIVAAVGYAGTIFYAFTFVKNVPSSDLSILHNPLIYFGKTVALLVSGVMAGIVAKQLKQRIYNTHKTMIERNRIVNLFSQQVSTDIANELLKEEKELESKRKHVSIMSLDIRGFTPLSENKQPEDIVAYQNSVFGFMIEAVNKHHGIINQILGDGFMATFGAPVSIGNNSENAVSASLEIITKLAEKNKSGEIEKTSIGIGVHAGDVVAGNVGTSKRKQYSISGNTVILASRIEQLNKIYNSQLLISEEVFNELSNGTVDHTNLGAVNVKGREKPITIIKLA